MVDEIQHQFDSTKLKWSVSSKRNARAAKIRQITHKTVPKVP